MSGGSIWSTCNWTSRWRRVPITSGTPNRSTGIRHPPDRVGGIVGYQDRTIGQFGDATGTAVDLAFRPFGDEAAQEILGRSTGPAVGEGHEQHLVAREVGAVPGAMLAD